MLTGLMWNGMILFFLEGYLELTLGVFIDWFYADWSSGHNYASHLISIPMGVTLILFPFFIYRFFNGHTEETLNQEQVV